VSRVRALSHLVWPPASNAGATGAAVLSPAHRIIRCAAACTADGPLTDGDTAATVIVGDALGLGLGEGLGLGLGDALGLGLGEGLGLQSRGRRRGWGGQAGSLLSSGCLLRHCTQLVKGVQPALQLCGACEPSGSPCGC
jgi:hypothetical protein